jgi:histone-lysine N-methyltransferase SETMAR
VTIDEVAYHMLISHGSVREIIHNHLGFHKVCARWVTKQLTKEHKCNRLNICQSLLNCYHQEGDAFLRNIITGDETWIHHYAPEIKRHSLEWKHLTLPAKKKKKKFKTQLSAGKVMLTIFWDSQGPILEHYQERGTTVNSAHCSEMLRGKLKPAIRTKHRVLLSKGVALLHDNAHLHTAAHTVETLCHLSFEVLKHPPYSPDLAPSDYHLFGPLKDALRGRHFASDQEVKGVVHAWLVTQPKTFFF